MIAIVSLLITLSLSLLVTRMAAMAFMLTGMSRESAKFQARSAFTGVGYTTQESEDVVSHPVRRRIAMLLMLLGNVGIATVMATVMLSFMQTSQSDQWYFYAGLLIGGVLGLWLLSRSRFIERHLNRLLAWGLRRWGQLQVRDYVAILQLQHGYAVTDLVVEPQDWLADRTLIELRLPAEGVLVLGIQRGKGVYLGTPTGETEVHAGDSLVLYGPIHRIEELDQRRGGRRGEDAHQEAVIEHEVELEVQEEIEEQLAEHREAEAE
ncbi:MAG: TrkA C-terminal domain-containing protein [Planctomycetota bacterium]|nr:TrkA C-terminal domain-containing protein [Planctomycetota bacterium]